MQYIEVAGEESKLHKNVHDKMNSPLKDLFELEESPKEIIYGNNYFKFALTRNPYSRILSSYLDKFVKNMWEKRRRAPGLGLDPEKEIPFIDFLHVIRNQSIEEMDIHWMPQAYLLPLATENLDFIGKFETFQDDWTFILKTMQERSNIQNSNLFQSQNITWHNTGANEKIKNYYTPETVDIVKELYRIDFEKFGYELKL